MNELDKLKLHLNNLKKQGHQEFSINVDWLLSVLNNLPNEKIKNIDFNSIEVDGGKF